MRRVQGLKDLAGEYDSLLCDVWGVLHNGVRAFPAAVDALTRFREAAGRSCSSPTRRGRTARSAISSAALGVPDDGL